LKDTPARKTASAPNPAKSLDRVSVFLKAGLPHMRQPKKVFWDGGLSECAPVVHALDKRASSDFRFEMTAGSEAERTARPLSFAEILKNTLRPRASVLDCFVRETRTPVT
jgi:hypothetical protein